MTTAHLPLPVALTVRCHGTTFQLAEVTVEMPVQVTQPSAKVTLADDIDALRVAVNRATDAIDQKYKKES